MDKLQPPRGTTDLMPDEMARHRHVIDTARKVAGLFGFNEVATPVFEFSDVFSRPLGESSDVVQKETYTFSDRGGESLTLRPEGTAPIMRALISNGLTQTLPQKYFYHGAMFRYERPQKGRMRQFHQIGVELLGVASPLADAEVIHCAAMILERLGVAAELHLNSLGDAESRERYRAALVKYLGGHKDGLSEDSLRRLEVNPLRILDSKDEGDIAICKNAPQFGDYLNNESKDYFNRVCDFLKTFGIDFNLDARLVRGLDYYCHTAFEFISDSIGAQGTVLGGGRYDGLSETLGGPPIPGVGWAAGIERLAMSGDVVPVAAPQVLLAGTAEEPENLLATLMRDLRTGGIRCAMAYEHNLGKAMKRGNRLGAHFAVIMGGDEIAKNTVSLRDMQSGDQREVAYDRAADEIIGAVKNSEQNNDS